MRPHWHGPIPHNWKTIMFTTTQSRSALLSKMREYLSTATAPQRIERIASQLTGAEWGDLDEKDRRIIAAVAATCGWARGHWPHWYPVGDPRRLPAGHVAQPDSAPQPKVIHAGRDRWGSSIERVAA
jgi:hypothetical protein